LASELLLACERQILMTQQVYDEKYGANPAERYERFFVPIIGAPIAKGLIHAAAPRNGERVLDVACGTGVVTRFLEERVGASGSVAGLDVNAAMLSVARAAAPADSSIAWHQGDAESMPLPDGGLDLVTCQMGLQFFRNKLAALREMRRVLAPRGRLALNVPGPVPPVFVVIADALARHVSREAAGFCHLVFSVHEAGELRELATAAGFSEVHVAAESVSLKGPPPAEFLWGYIGCTPLSGHVAGLDDARRAALENDVREGLERLVTDGQLALDVRMSTLTAS
jgi:ubiquinone/menaquinone biosynthesis C-methylase UbiE